MSWKSALLSVVPCLLVASMLGCGICGPSARIPVTDPSGKNTADTAAKDPSTAASEDLPGLKELNPEDRKLAEKQKYCPKTGELLGSMGKPVKITLNDRTVFLCCEGCEAAVKKDPEKYLKKLDELLAKK